MHFGGTPEKIDRIEVIVECEFEKDAAARAGMKRGFFVLGKGKPRKRFNTEGREIGAQRAQRRGRGISEGGGIREGCGDR